MKWYEAIPDRLWIIFFYFWTALWAIFTKLADVHEPDTSEVQAWVEAWADSLD